MKQQRVALANFPLYRIFLPTVFVLFFPHCDEERRDSTATFFVHHLSRPSILGACLLYRVSRILFVVSLVPSSAASRLNVKSRTSSRPARSEAQVERNARSKILKRRTETAYDDEKIDGDESKNEQ